MIGPGGEEANGDRDSDQEERRPDLRLAPAAAAGWLGSWLGTDGRSWPLIIGAVVLAALIATMIIRRSWLLAGAAVLLAGTMIIGGAHQAALSGTATSRLAAAEVVARVQLVVTEEPQVQQGQWSTYLVAGARIRELTGRGHRWVERAPVLLIASGDQLPAWQSLPIGTVVSSTVRLAEPEPGSDVAAVAQARAAPEKIADPRADLRWVERVRAGLRAAVAGGAPEQRALLPSLVLGDTRAITAELKADFVTTGLTHLTAVSGANLAIMLAFMIMLARWIGVRGWWLRVVGVLGVIIFVGLCRTEPSVLRAAAMGLVALAALGLSGRSKGLRSLFVAMIALVIIDPWLGRSVGFALSVLASGGIVWWSRRWALALQRWMPLVLAESITVPLAAHLVTLPVATALSGKVSMIGVLTNAVAGPFVGPATVLGFAAAGLSVLSPPIAWLVGLLGCWLTQPILWAAHYGSVLPGAAWAWPTGPPALAVLAVACLVLGLAMPVLLRRGWLAVAVAVMMIIGVVRAPAQPGWPPREWTVVACDVGQGDGLVIKVGAGSAVVVDTGPDPVPMRHCLDQLRIRTVPLVILSHFHADHVGGLSGVLAGRRVGRFWVSPYPSPVQEAQRVNALAAARQIPVSVPAVGSTVTVGDARITVVGPVDRSPPVPAVAEDSGESSAENDQSIAAKITTAGVTVLLTGDLEPTEQQRVLDSGADLRADVLKVPHHGSARQDADFIAATGARLAIASAGQNNSYGHPAPSTVDLLRRYGATVLCTCQRGAVAVAAAEDRPGSRLTVVTQRADR